MIFCLECGNTCIKVGIFDDESQLVERFIIKTSLNLTSDEYAIRFKTFIKKEFEFDGAIISCVVPSLTLILESAIESAINVKPMILNNKIKTKLAIKTDNPLEVGADFICTAIGAKKEGIKPPFAICDFGTTTKISVIDPSGAFIGCVITAGIGITIDSLANKTAQLFAVESSLPKKILGKNSKDSIQSGVLYGQIFMIERFVDKLEEELGYKLNKIITGGYSNILKNNVSGFYFLNNLSLIGLNQIYKYNVSDYEK